MATGQVRITGLRQLRKSLGQASPQLSRRLTGVHRQISTRIAGKASPKIAGLPSPGGHLAQLVYVLEPPKPRRVLLCSVLIRLFMQAYSERCIMSRGVIMFPGRDRGRRGLERHGPPTSCTGLARCSRRLLKGSLWMSIWRR